MAMERLPLIWRSSLAMGMLLLAGCSSHAPSTASGTGQPLEQRQGYWVDRSLHGKAVDHRIKSLVIHYTAVDDTESIKELTGPDVSIHYLIMSKPGRFQGKPVVMQLADEQARAWQAGNSSWAGRTGLNDTSIGIEIVNLGYRQTPHGRRYLPFTASQIQLVKALAKDIVTRYDIDPVNVVGHSDIAPGRKPDPGPLFPWQQLAQAGVGAWPDQDKVKRYWQRFNERGLPSVSQLQKGLARYGYRLAISGRLDADTRTVLESFQKHFRPADYQGNYDAQSAAILFALLEKYKGAALVHSILGA